MLLLNSDGLAIWKHKQLLMVFAQRTSRWRDRILVLDESDGHRIVILDAPFSTFDLSDWEPMTPYEYARVKQFYREIRLDEPEGSCLAGGSGLPEHLRLDVIEFTNYPEDDLSIHILRLVSLHLKTMSDADKEKLIDTFNEILGIWRLKPPAS